VPCDAVSFTGWRPNELGYVLRLPHVGRGSPPCGNSPPNDKNREVHKMCARYHEILDVKFSRELGFEPIVNWFDPAPILLAIMLPPPIQPISNENELSTIFSIGFVSVGFWTWSKD
jgi:hypothetical protein